MDLLIASAAFGSLLPLHPTLPVCCSTDPPALLTLEAFCLPHHLLACLPPTCIHLTRLLPTCIHMTRRLPVCRLPRSFPSRRAGGGGCGGRAAALPLLQVPVLGPGCAAALVRKCPRNAEILLVAVRTPSPPSTCVGTRVRCCNGIKCFTHTGSFHWLAECAALSSKYLFWDPGALLLRL